ncbi:MAG: hypothetical protein J2O44_06580, partial [Porphyrobacter sp.]|nr:hypothetical protein [Porphyrobacter sp.]
VSASLAAAEVAPLAAAVAGPLAALAALLASVAASLASLAAAEVSLAALPVSFFLQAPRASTQAAAATIITFFISGKLPVQWGLGIAIFAAAGIITNRSC